MRKRICFTCEKEFITTKPPSRGIQKYCSNECRAFLNKLSEEKKIEILKIEFDKKVIRTSTCWNWNGLKTPDGYARLSCSTKYGTDKGHIASFLINKGKISEGLVVRHLCHNRICTNPEHLEIGTPKENILDSVKDGKTKKGSQHHNSSLDELQVKEVKRLLEKKYRGRVISNLLKIPELVVSRIKRGITYKDQGNEQYS